MFLATDRIPDALQILFLEYGQRGGLPYLCWAVSLIKIDIWVTNLHFAVDSVDIGVVVRVVLDDIEF
jgi:hypothetical protein